MPAVTVEQAELTRFGETWRNNGGGLSRTPPQSSSQLGNLFDAAVGASLVMMLGGIPIVRPASTALTASVADCVEVGPVRIIGGVRPQNFDVGYRPEMTVELKLTRHRPRRLCVWKNFRRRSRRPTSADIKVCRLTQSRSE